MSFIEEAKEMYERKLISRAVRDKLLKANQAFAEKLKAERKHNDAIARQLLVKDYLANGKRWKSKQKQNAFRAIMKRRHQIHHKLFRRVGEKHDPDFDSP